MKITFWGVRGSIPCPGPQTVKYGGNTPCLEVQLPEERRVLIIDAGSGIRELGNSLLGRNLSWNTTGLDIFLTHTHWDHIQGLPFFTPIYLPAARMNIYGPVTGEEQSIKEALGLTLSYRYFPVRQDELSSHIRYIDIREGSFDLGGGLQLQTRYLNHPVLCLGYRFEYRGRVFCTAYDTEPFRNLFCTDPTQPGYDEHLHREGDEAARAANERLEEFYRNADLLIYDAQYTRAEYHAGKKGWGHTACEDAVDTAIRAGVKQLALFHHDPSRTDGQLDALAGEIEGYKGRHDLEVSFAREGTTIELRP
ncbi:MAG TPA: MBL fold metallo-hydrolase [Syntrophales bacterium]|nr:MBL fold metallo-hydrolase [Syntrophales bacterium]